MPHVVLAGSSGDVAESTCNTLALKEHPNNGDYKAMGAVCSTAARYQEKLASTISDNEERQKHRIMQASDLYSAAGAYLILGDAKTGAKLLAASRIVFADLRDRGVTADIRQKGALGVTQIDRVLGDIQAPK